MMHIGRQDSVEAGEGGGERRRCVWTRTTDIGWDRQRYNKRHTRDLQRDKIGPYNDGVYGERDTSP
jgi:hypothetical protein